MDKISIFVSYRRDDSQHQTDRICEYLERDFQVFQDVEGIPLGADIRQVLTAQVAACDVFLAVIGDAWLSITGEGGTRRLDDPEDFVRIEVEAALSRNVPVIPVLVGTSPMPRDRELPESLRALAYRLGLRVRPRPDFRHDMDRLVRGIQQVGSSVRVSQSSGADVKNHSVGMIESARSQPTVAAAPAASFTNSLGMTMVRIEPGEFLMGSTRAQIDLLLKQFPDAKREWFDDEQPQHPVRITKPFYLAAHPVTVGQFREFIERSGCKTVNEWRDAGFDQGENHPVVKVSHDDAVAFLNWLNDQEKGLNRSYRLPSEAAWEYACRAGGKGVYGTGDDPAELDRVAWFAANSGGATHPVGQKEANRFGLHDMLGNVWEWCDDWFDPSFYKSSSRENPSNATKAPDRAFRGGGWNFVPGYCRPASRVWGAPGYRFSNLGFRVAAALPARWVPSRAGPAARLPRSRCFRPGERQPGPPRAGSDRERSGRCNRGNEGRNAGKRRHDPKGSSRCSYDSPTDTWRIHPDQVQTRRSRTSPGRP